MPYATLRPPCSRPLALYYERHGQGPPLLLIRGFMRSMRFWWPFAESLGEGLGLIAFDNRGIGRSERPLGLYSTAQMADDAAALLDALGVESAHVFGMSLGGMIAQELALRHPSRVQRLILGATTAGGPSAVRIPWAQRLTLARSAALPPREAMQTTASLTLAAPYLREHPEVVDRWLGLMEIDRPQRRGFLGQAAAALRHDAWERLPHLKAPTLVVTGDADQLIPPENSRLLAERIPQARLKILPGAGHDLTTEQPDAMAWLVRDFCTRA